MKNTNIAIAVAAGVALSGCSEPQEEIRVIYKEPTQAQIQAAVDKHLASLNKEDEELKAFLAEIKKTNPDVAAARYAFENGEKVLKVAMVKDGGITEYTIPVATGAFAGYAGASLANKLNSMTFPSRNGNPDCDLEDLLEGDSDCRQSNGSSYGSSSSHSSNTFVFVSFPSTRYYSDSEYRTASRKETKKYSEQKVKQTARQEAQEIQSKADSGLRNNYSTTSKPYSSSVSDDNYQSTNPAPKTETKSTLTQSRQAFSTQRSSARSSGMSFGGRGNGG